MSFERKYVILDISELDNLDFSKVMEDSAETIRKNLAGTQFFVKFTGTIPEQLKGKDTYNHTDIMSILNDPSGGWFEELN
tara:strand:+ start:501 stop:740 length:240 start_codon:yes stop_codon:yes gene_type:complete